MKKRGGNPQSAHHQGAQEPATNQWRLVLLCAAVAATLGLGAAFAWHRFGTKGGDDSPERPLTFHRDIAPLVYQHCAGCHHPGESAPFDLLTYNDVRKHAREIVEVTSQRVMPPWLPEPGYGDFVGERSLNTAEIQRLQRWVDQGTPEGNPGDAPPRPQWREGWQLGQPDLLIRLPEPYTLAAEGKDVYRNFVIPIPTTRQRYVRAVEFEPGNGRVVHHAFLYLDPTRDSRRRDEEDREPGFPGLHTPPSAQSPPGHFLSWQPGKVASLEKDELTWVLATNCDLVVQMHLRPSGKPERVQPSIGFYFSENAPTQVPYKFGLMKLDLDIPAGASNHLAREDYVLPVDVDLLRVLPHAHYLGRQLQATATLPDGTTRWLFRIPRWDFNWQGDYAYKKPLPLPKGTLISMLYSYDNSTNNVRNPNQPPQEVRYGVNSSDEMAELWLQVLPRGSNALATLEADQRPRVFTNSIAYNNYLLRLDPGNARAHTELGRALMFLNRLAEAEPHLRRAVELQPQADEARYALGLLLRMQNKLAESKAQFQAVLLLNPDHFKAYGNLGLILLEEGDLDGAQLQFEAVLRLSPGEEIAQSSLRQIAQLRAGKK